MRILLKKIIREIKSTHQWVILVRKPGTQWIKLNQPSSVSRADPCVVNYNEKIFIFYEEFDIELRKGYICVGELNYDEKKLDNTKIILKHNYHLSFPHVFKYKNKYYMIPESSQNNTIDLYEFINFPYILAKKRNIIENISAADTIFLQHNNYCWLFTSIKYENKKLHNNNLSAFYAKDLLNDDFTEHPENPISSGDNYSRNAGGILTVNNELFRVSQDCEKIYGEKINYLKIKSLSTKNYIEKIVGEVIPPKGYIAFHTVNNSGDIQVADAKIVLLEFKHIFKNIIKIFNKLIKKINNI